MACRLLAALFLARAACGAIEIHVSSTKGCDTAGDGSVQGPFKTVDRALAAARGVPGEGRRSVVLHGGTYAPIRLRAEDSGNPMRPLEIRGAEGEAPSIVDAGVGIPRRAFSRVGSGPLVRADLFEHGVAPTTLGSMVSGGAVGDCQHKKTDLIFAGERMTLARWPNLQGTRWAFANIDVGGDGFVGVNTTRQPEASRISNWSLEPDPWIHGYWTFDWTDSYVGVSNISISAGLGNLSLHPPTEIKANARFYGVNLLCELDAPGEYYINQKNGTLYFYPPLPLEEWSQSDLAFLTNDPIALNISGASHVAVENLIVRHAQEVGLLAESVRHVRIRNVTIGHVGQTGVILDGHGYELLDSQVYDIGCAGVQASGGDVLSLSPGSNVVSGNVIRRPALWKRTYMPALRWGGVNNTFSKNLLADAPHNCVLGGGNTLAAAGCLHEENVIENCAYEASDTGAWYSCGQKGAWTTRGNIARGNRFRHIRCGISGRSVEGCGGGVQAVYLDDQMSGWLWENNTFEDCDTALFIGGGRSNSLIGNRIVNSSLAVHFDNRGMGWAKHQCCANCTAAKDVQEALNGPAGAEWRRRWPDLLGVLQGDHLCVPVYNRIINNTFKDTKRFMDATDAQVSSWLSVSEGNVRAGHASVGVAAPLEEAAFAVYV